MTSAPGSPRGWPATFRRRSRASTWPRPGWPPAARTGRVEPGGGGVRRRGRRPGPAGGRRVRARAVHQAVHARRRAARFPGRPGRLDRREGHRLERGHRRRPARVRPGPAARHADPVLGHRHHHLVAAALLGLRATTPAPRCRPAIRRTCPPRSASSAASGSRSPSRPANWPSGTSRVTSWAEHDRGGHFPAVAEPAAAGRRHCATCSGRCARTPGKGARTPAEPGTAIRPPSGT